MKKYFGTDGIRGQVGTLPISADWVLKLGWAVGSVIAAQVAPAKASVIIGKDTRISGYLLESAFEAGLASSGVDILLSGPIPTPAVAFLTHELNASLGVVISASHNPFQDNGLKFFDSHGYKLTDNLEFMIESQLEKPFSTVKSDCLGKAIRVRDAEKRYIDFCLHTFPENLSLKGLTIVLDCANGATYRIAPTLFRMLEAQVIEMNTIPNGLNINEQCGSTHPNFLAERVIEVQADLGIAFDGDGDRVIMIDNNGELLDGDDLVFIITKWYANSKRLTGGVIGTLMSNFGLEKAIQQLGVDFIRTAVGDHFVLEKALQNGWNLGGEPSGHILCLDYSTTGDGIIGALQVLAASLSLGLSIGTIKKEMTKYPQALINLSIERDDETNPQIVKETFLENSLVKSAILEAEAQLNNEGRVLVRPSGTEPLIRVLVEGKNNMLVQNIATSLVNNLKQYL